MSFIARGFRGPLRCPFIRQHVPELPLSFPANHPLDPDMPDDRTRLIEAAVRPFEDNAELKLAAAQLLGEIMTPEPAGTTEAIQRWETVDARTRKPAWRAVLFVVLAIVSAAVLADGARVLIHFENMIPTMGGSHFVDFFHNSPKITEAAFARRLNADEVRLLFGDLSKRSAPERMKVMWDSEPGNPAYFADFVNAYMEESGGKLPPDFLKTARRIDPENAWFTYVAAAVRATDAVKKRTPTKAAKAANATPEWDVLDSAALNDLLALLRDARNQPKCKTYQNELGRARVKSLPTGTPAEVTFALGYRFGTSLAAEVELRHLISALSAKAWLCGEENDQAAFNELLIDADGFLRKRMDAEVESQLAEFINQNAAYGFASNAAPAARKLGLFENLVKLDPQLEEFTRRKAEYETRKSDPNSERIQQHGGSLASTIVISPFRRFQNPPQITMEDLEPGRLMDHATLGWTATYFAWAALIVAMGAAAAFRFWSPALICRLAARLELLIQPRDWLWVIVFGIVLPIAYFIAVTRYTPWGGRELSMNWNELSVPYFDDLPLGLAQHVGLTLLIVFSCGAASCWRLRSRTKSLGLVTASSFGLLVPVACLAAFIPVSGWSVVHSSEAIAVTAWGFAGISLVWLILIGFQSLFGRVQTRLRHGIVARMLVPCCAFAAILALSAAPFYKVMAFEWSGKDTLVRASENFPSGSEFEHRLTLQLRKELREILGYDP